MQECETQADGCEPVDKNCCERILDSLDCPDSFLDRPGEAETYRAGDLNGSQQGKSRVTNYTVKCC